VAVSKARADKAENVLNMLKERGLVHMPTSIPSSPSSPYSTHDTEIVSMDEKENQGIVKDKKNELNNNNTLIEKKNDDTIIHVNNVHLEFPLESDSSPDFSESEKNTSQFYRFDHDSDNNREAGGRDDGHDHDDGDQERRSTREDFSGSFTDAVHAIVQLKSIGHQIPADNGQEMAQTHYSSISPPIPILSEKKRKITHHL